MTENLRVDKTEEGFRKLDKAFADGIALIRSEVESGLITDAYGASFAKYYQEMRELNAKEAAVRGITLLHAVPDEGNVSDKTGAPAADKLI